MLDAIMVAMSGMGSVFIFLLLLIGVINILGKLTLKARNGELAAMQAEKEKAAKARAAKAAKKKNKNNASGESAVPMAAITAAVHTFRANQAK